MTYHRSYRRAIAARAARVLQKAGRSIAEVAKEMGVHLSTVYRWNHSLILESQPCAPSSRS